jgi:hypothetical protein
VLGSGIAAVSPRSVSGHEPGRGVSIPIQVSELGSLNPGFEIQGSERSTAMPCTLVGILAVCCVMISALPAAAGTGSCKPESNGGSAPVLICGTGKDAAHVIGNAVSPSHRLALAWRAYDEASSAQGLYQSLIVRLRDGAILGSADAIYRDPGSTHGNNFFVATAWSPNSRFMVAAFDSPHQAVRIDVYTFRQRDDALTGPIDLLPVIGPAVRALMKDAPHADACDFSVLAKRPVTIDNRGVAQGTVIVTGCAAGQQHAYDVRVRVKHDPASSEPSRLGTEVLSVNPTLGGD